MAHPLWPLYDLRLRTERLELFLPNEDELVELCQLARAGIHPPDEMPFAIPWSIKPSPRFEREFIQFHWGTRADVVAGRLGPRPGRVARGPAWSASRAWSPGTSR